MKLKAQATKVKISKWDYIRLKCSRTAEEIIKKMKKQSKEWGEIFANYISDKELISKYIRNSFNSTA